MTDFTDDERHTIRTAALGAMAVVSMADPGFFATFKESAAGSRAFAQAPPEIRNLIAGGPMMPPKASSKEDLEAQVVAAIGQAVAILSGKDPSMLQGFRTVMDAAIQAVAEASKGVTPAEQAAMDKIKAALAAAPEAPATAASAASEGSTDIIDAEIVDEKE